MVSWKKVAIAATMATLAGIVGMAAQGGYALAYGNSGDAQQVYQLEISGNCNNPDLCGDMLGGFWGWAVLYDDGTGEAEATDCLHSADFSGAQHSHVDFTWVAAGGFIVITSETDVIVGRGTPTTVEIPDEFEPLTPAAPGHYSTADLAGFFGLTPGPGVALETQVVALPVG